MSETTDTGADITATDTTAATTTDAADTATTTTDAGDGGDSGDDAGSTDAGADGQQQTEEPKKPKSPVAQLQGRVGHLTKTLHEKDAELASERQRREALEALFAAQGKNPDGSDAPTPKPAAPSATLVKGSPEWNEAVRSEAKQIAAAEAFTAQCNTIFDEGRKKHGAVFEDGVKTLNALGLMDANLVNAAIATGAAPDVLNALGADTEEAQRIAGLQPVQMGVELAKLASKLAAPKAAPQVSRAPAPITPVGSSVKAEVDLATAAKGDDMDAYVAARKAQGSRWAK